MAGLQNHCSQSRYQGYCMRSRLEGPSLLKSLSAGSRRYYELLRAGDRVLVLPALDFFPCQAV